VVLVELRATADVLGGSLLTVRLGCVVTGVRFVDEAGEVGFAELVAATPVSPGELSGVRLLDPDAAEPAPPTDGALSTTGVKAGPPISAAAAGSSDGTVPGTSDGTGTTSAAVAALEVVESVALTVVAGAAEDRLDDAAAVVATGKASCPDEWN
jgi:hypothetical protein